MPGSIDLLIRCSSDPPTDLQVFLSAPGWQEAFVVTCPEDLIGLQEAWSTRFLRHHDPAFPWPEGAAVVRSYSERLLLALEQWLREPGWQRLMQVLRDRPGLPLTLRLDGVPTGIACLPWEALPLQRPIWRLEAVAAGSEAPAPVPPRARRPRVLLVVGSEQGLNLDGEVSLLQAQERRGRIHLQLLRGAGCSAAALRQALAAPSGWDAVLFLGHSEGGPDGGLLHLGDGSQLDGASLNNDWAAAASHGLRLLLLNSCSGLALARQAVRSGIGWAVCFLEPVPAGAAALAFSRMLQELEGGAVLTTGIGRTRDVLATTPGCEGCGLLLSVVGATGAPPFHLPLRRRRQLALRLASTQRRQLAAAGLLTLVALVNEVTPTNPLNTYLLDRRLDVQRFWRQLTHQPGPQPGREHPAIPVLLLDPTTTLPELGVTPAPDHTSRLALAQVLRRTPVAQVPVVGLDVTFDQNRPGTALLAAEIRRQAGRRVIGGYAGQQSDPGQGSSGDTWLKGSVLATAGLQPRDLAVGTAAGGEGDKPVPLQLIAAISANTFAGSLAASGRGSLPADRVLDWSLHWSPWIRLVTPADLATLKAPLLLVGTNGQLGNQAVDLFTAPATVQNALMRGDRPLWTGNVREVPGVLVQAVLIQSLNLQHWLTPVSQTLCTLAGGGLGLLLAALIEARRRRLLAVGLITLVSCLLAWTLAIGPLWLVPLLLPLLALAAASFSRDD